MYRIIAAYVVVLLVAGLGVRVLSDASISFDLADLNGLVSVYPAGEMPPHYYSALGNVDWSSGVDSDNLEQPHLKGLDQFAALER